MVIEAADLSDLEAVQKLLQRMLALCLSTCWSTTPG
jgi:hypothetical protein